MVDDSRLCTACRRAQPVKKLLATPGLRLYITTYPGRRFDKELDHQAVDEFTPQDFQAVRYLGVSVSYRIREWLAAEGREAGHGKRPRLIPIYDQDRIGSKLEVSQSDLWETMWCALRDRGVRQLLQDIQADVTEAADLSLLRVLNIVVRMSAPHGQLGRTGTRALNTPSP
jgi:hypothetical protein